MKNNTDKSPQVWKKIHELDFITHIPEGKKTVIVFACDKDGQTVGIGYHNYQELKDTTLGAAKIIAGTQALSKAEKFYTRTLK